LPDKVAKSEYHIFGFLKVFLSSCLIILIISYIKQDVDLK